MARVSIEDLDEENDIGREEMKAVFGGTGNNPFLHNRRFGDSPDGTTVKDVPDGTEFQAGRTGGSAMEHMDYPWLDRKK